MRVTWLGPGGLVQGAQRCGAGIKRERERGLGEGQGQGEERRLEACTALT